MKKILVVEDEYYARKSIVKILQESDLDIQVCGEAENGMKAIELLEEYKDIALVITDIQMQKMGGLELASYLHKHIPEIDLTIRHPQNDNAELLWHCGPFPYSLKKDGVEAKLVDGQERFELKQGDLTVCRFDDVDGEYYLFAGEAKTTTGPETNGTYVWMETDNWKRWEEKLMFGPYIHHLGCVYGHYLPVLREVSRYLGIHFDNAHEQGIYSL